MHMYDARKITFYMTSQNKDMGFEKVGLAI
jgi:hypothetical protein